MQIKVTTNQDATSLTAPNLLGYGELEWSVSSWNVKCYNHLDLDIIQPFLLNIYLRET